MSTAANNTIRFGTAGLSNSYKAKGYKDMLAVPEYTASFGLNAFEYQAGRGVRLAKPKADALAEKGKEYGIQYSIHAPYYISMSSMEEEKRLNSVNYILQSAAAVKMLGGNRVIFHPGSAGKQSRSQAMEKAADTLRQMLRALDENGHDDIVLCPETMGKNNQLGTLAEVLQLCTLDSRLIPCVDFGHINARTQGSVNGMQAYRDILDEMEAAIGRQRASRFHAHFSKIEYSQGGEKRHLTFDDTVYGPEYEPLLQLVAQRELTPVIICESSGTQAEDAQAMCQYYNSL